MFYYPILISLWIMAIALALFIMAQAILLIERIVSHVRHKIPYVPSSRPAHDAIIRQIRQYYPDAQTICDIGSGYGFVTRKIARRCHMHAVGLECMPAAAWIGWILDRITFSRTRTIWCDAFKYLDACDGFDIGIAYLGPDVNPQLAKYRDKFRVLITLDVPITGLTPTRTIDAGPGYTKYGQDKYPHRLFIYEFN